MAKQYIKNKQKKKQTRSTNCNRKTANDTQIISILKENSCITANITKPLS